MNIGIDLGTTYCCIAYKNPITNSLNVIDNPQKGGKSIPSVVSFADDEVHFNHDAVLMKKSHPE
jgi:molecular chaperone DnaK (HSP70)